MCYTINNRRKTYRKAIHHGTRTTHHQRRIPPFRAILLYRHAGHQPAQHGALLADLSADDTPQSQKHQRIRSRFLDRNKHSLPDNDDKRRLILRRTNRVYDLQTAPGQTEPAAYSAADPHLCCGRIHYSMRCMDFRFHILRSGILKCLQSASDIINMIVHKRRGFLFPPLFRMPHARRCA